MLATVVVPSTSDSPDFHENESTATAVVVEPEQTLKSVTPRLKREVRTSDECCKFQNPKTGEICGSKFFLEVDHIQPRYLGGGNERKNLRMMCKAHNLYRYEQNL